MQDRAGVHYGYSAFRLLLLVVVAMVFYIALSSLQKALEWFMK
jgi:hypothetical protein